MYELSKKYASIEALKYVKKNMLVSIGSGTTVFEFINLLGKKENIDNLNLKFITASNYSRELALKNNLKVIEDKDVIESDVMIDGADEIDINKNIIKGGGRALLKEKILAHATKKLIIIAEENKLKKKLGSFGIPLEVNNFCLYSTINQINKLKLETEILDGYSDSGNKTIKIINGHEKYNLNNLNEQLLKIPGVIETGIFFIKNIDIILSNEIGKISKL